MAAHYIVERVKDWYRTERDEMFERHLLLNNDNIITVRLYKSSYEQNPTMSEQAIGLVYAYDSVEIVQFEFPTFYLHIYLPIPYLYKIGYITEDEWLGPVPLPNMKYFIAATQFTDRLAVELVDLNVAANNLNLRRIVVSVLGPTLLRTKTVITYDELDNIRRRMRNQELFGGRSLLDAWTILYEFFNKNKRGLVNEVVKISQDYNRVFRPYRAVYNTRTWKPVLS